VKGQGKRGSTKEQQQKPASKAKSRARGVSDSESESGNTSNGESGNEAAAVQRLWISSNKSTPDSVKSSSEDEPSLVSGGCAMSSSLSLVSLSETRAGRSLFFVSFSAVTFRNKLQDHGLSPNPNYG
jgi:hypothetical protein